MEEDEGHGCDRSQQISPLSVNKNPLESALTFVTSRLKKFGVVSMEASGFCSLKQVIFQN